LFRKREGRLRELDSLDFRLVKSLRSYSLAVGVDRKYRFFVVVRYFHLGGMKKEQGPFGRREKGGGG